MDAPGLAEARLTITAPFSAAVVETVGDEVGLTPPPPPFPPPHPHIKALDNRIAFRIVAFTDIATLRFRERVKEPIRAPYLTRLFNYPQIPASNVRRAMEVSGSLLLRLMLSCASKRPQVLHSGAQ